VLLITYMVYLKLSDLIKLNNMCVQSMMILIHHVYLNNSLVHVNFLSLNLGQLLRAHVIIRRNRLSTV